MEAIAWIRPIRCTPTQKIVLWALADRANEKGEAWPSIDTLKEATCLSERAIQGALLDLRKARILEADVGGGRCRTTLYRLPLGMNPADFSTEKTPHVVHDTPQQVRGNRAAETPQLLHKTPQLVHETPQLLRETPQQLHPIPQEPTYPKEKSNKRERAVAKPKAQTELPDWLPADAWDEWEAHRKALKHPMTDGARKLSIRDLGKLRDEGNDPRAVIEQSIVRGWRGLFPIRDQQASRRHPQGPLHAQPQQRRSVHDNIGWMFGQPSRTPFDFDGQAEETTH